MLDPEKAIPMTVRVSEGAGIANIGVKAYIYWNNLFFWIQSIMTNLRYILSFDFLLCAQHSQ